MTYEQRHRIMMKEYYLWNRECRLKYAREYYRQNREKILAKARERYKAKKLFHPYNN